MCEIPRYVCSYFLLEVKSHKIFHFCLIFKKFQFFQSEKDQQMYRELGVRPEAAKGGFQLMFDSKLAKR